MKRTHPTSLVSSFLVLAASSLALAHGGGAHLKGTFKSAEGSALTLVTTDQKTVTVQTTAETKFEKSGQPSSAAELAPGEKVVVHAAKGKDGALTAQVVKFGKPAKGAKPAAAHPSGAPSAHPAHEHAGH